MNKLIVFTGGPGAGKTSVIEQLKTQGFICSPETGRHVIQRQVANHGSALPWNDKQAFRDEMMKAEVSNYRAFNVRQAEVFFDRSIVDVYGYSKLEQLPISHELITHCQTLRYQSQCSFFHRGRRYSATMKSESKIFLKRSPRINRWSTLITSLVIN
ncbi:conserved hypothetical protein [Vibrio antiquarius]|uniref:NadR/Ttd14 AAA domain-containing protein n=2 Tax=Vibrio antiquarius (strain Ex25) TaxID=150340 RepID=A0ABM9WUX6_VIBAE|nr:hypothetical protein VEA_000254 [Vibrio antiquarius]EDN57128.1 conserved hypothetical protein [Vibrio antiquarius]